jgi:hypothetical protein
MKKRTNQRLIKILLLSATIITCGSISKCQAENLENIVDILAAPTLRTLQNHLEHDDRDEVTTGVRGVLNVVQNNVIDVIDQLAGHNRVTRIALQSIREVEQRFLTFFDDLRNDLPACFRRPINFLKKCTRKIAGALRSVITELDNFLN